MADIVGLLASILQLVDTVAKGHGYIQDFRHASKDQQRLLLEIHSLAALIREMDKRIEKDQNAGGGMLRFAEPLIQLKETLERLTRNSKITDRLTWSLWGKDDVQDGLKTIERFKSLLNAWLGMDISLEPYLPDLDPDILSIIEDATEEQRINQNYIAKSVRDVARNQERHHDSAERDTIIEWLSPLNFFLRQADIFGTRQPGTGGWLLEDDLFKEWKWGVGKILWCPGMPGAGKTVLASIVVDNLRATLDSQNTGVAVLYLNHKETETQSPSNLLAGVWRQLVLEKLISSAVHGIYEKHREPRTRPSLDEIDTILCSIVSQYSDVFIIVDALDEYPEEKRDILLRRLSSLGPTVNLMLTSRPHVQIDHVVGDADIETLNIRAAEDDIRQYLEAQIVKSSRLSKHIKNSPGLREEIERRIVGRSEGMFLLAKLHIDSLTTKHTVKAVREALANLPIDLNSTYDEVMERINRQSEDDRNIARLALCWISNAKRLLHIFELREALAVEEGTTKLDPDNLLDTDTILSVCAGLVIIDEEDGLDYLERVQAKIFPRASVDITLACITYLSFTVFSRKIHNPDIFFDRKSLLDYAVEYCLVHARGQPESDMKDFILSFLANCTRWREFWNSRHREEEIPESTGGVWIAAAFRLEEICRHLITTNGAGTVLQKAALEGRTDIVQILIDHGADPNATEGEYDSALQAACVRGHEDVLPLLLDRSADIDFRGKYGTALQVAAFFGHTQCVALLIQAGASINVEGGCYGTALYAASSRGNNAIVRLLIPNSAETTPVPETDTALHAASAGGYLEIVRILMEHGAGTNAEGGSHGSALQAASFAGHTAIARVLIEHGVDINAKGGQYGSALYAASVGGYLEIVRVLMEHSADINAEGGNHGSALQAASFAGHTAIARLLIEHGVDINTKGGEYGSALQAAACMGNEAIVMMLLERGADVNVKGGHYGSVLQAASFSGHTRIASLLLDHGADINAGGGEFGSALQAAACTGNEAIVMMLLERGADVNVKGGLYGSVLQAASFSGHTRIASLLLDHARSSRYQRGSERQEM
ncbi:ankyrin repeat-containing domain protein [Mycena vulgaris]|nr:ankyrin repeat-containing domain protein [Mycena vulgaris]